MELPWYEQAHEEDHGPQKQAEWGAVVQAFTGRVGDSRRDWIRAPCPLCVEADGKEDHKESLGYNPWTGKYRCLAGETSVLTWDGYKPIRDLSGTTCKLLAVGQDGISRWVEAPVSSFGVQRLYEVVLSRTGVKKSVFTTAEHRWFVRKSIGKYRETTTLGLAPGDRLQAAVLPRSGYMFPSPLGVAAGFTFGDGTKTQRCARAYFFGAKDAALLPFFAFGHVIKRPDRTIVDGLPFYFKELPSIDEACTYLYGWLAGYFAADGCVDTTGMPTIASASKAHLEFVRRVCIRLGIFTYAVRTQHRCGKGKVGSPLYQLSLGRSTLSADFFLIPEHRARWAANKAVKERVGWVVESVRKTARVEEVFCATVPEHGSFTLEGHLLTGNCFKCGCWGFLPINSRVELADGHELPQGEREKEVKPLQPATGFVALFEEPGLSAGSYEWARKYLRDPVSATPRGRGLPDSVSRAAGLGAALTGPLGGRVVVPIPDYTDPQRAWRGWVARAVFDGPGVMPYRYAKGFDRLGVVYNEPVLYLETDEPCFIVEGCFDALALWPDAVAVLGKPLESQMPLFLRARRPLAVALDGDAFSDSQTLAWNLQHHGKMAHAIRLPAKKDPDDMGKAWLSEQFARLMRA